MTKILIEIPHPIIEALDTISKHIQLSRSELIRIAIASWIKDHNTKTKSDAFGILKNTMKEDGVEFQTRIRSEW